MAKAGENKALVLRYRGAPHTRIVGDLRWDAANNWTLTVPFDAELVKTLLMQKSGGQDEFEVVAEVVEDAAE